MTRNRRIGLLILLGMVAGALLLLAGSLSGLTMEEGRPPTLGWRPEGETDWVPHFGRLVILMMALYILAVVFLLPARVRRYAILVLVVVAAFAFGLLWLSMQLEQAPLPEAPPTPALPAQTPTPGTTPPETVEPPPAWEAPDPPPTWVFLLLSFGAALLLLAVLAGSAWFFWQRRYPRLWLTQRDRQLAQLRRQAEEALRALRGGGEVRDVIIRCYLEMESVLAAERGIEREETMTPREFEEQLMALGLPREPVVDLTRLFETVRYGQYIAGADEERRAHDSLSAIVAACRRAS